MTFFFLVVFFFFQLADINLSYLQLLATEIIKNQLGPFLQNTCLVNSIERTPHLSLGCSSGMLLVKCNGSLVNTSDTVQHGAVYSLEPRLRGGKGV